MSLDDAQIDLVRAHAGSALGAAALTFGLCWPNDSKLSSHIELELGRTESLSEAAERTGALWSPTWLLDAGHRAYDAAGAELWTDTPSSVAGKVRWEPIPRLCRLDDQTADDAVGIRYRRRLAGEVAVAALWTRAAAAEGIDPSIRPSSNLSGNTRGARFRDVLVEFLRVGLPEDWRVEREVPLTTIRGLHMRRNVGQRKSDIVVIDPGSRLIAVISSKWTWRSDRGTEAAQMVPLNRYRPDVPYALVTAEFPRSATVSRESIEDAAYHVSPAWVGAWNAMQKLTHRSPREEWPTLSSIEAVGRETAEILGLPGLESLVSDILGSGSIL